MYFSMHWLKHCCSPLLKEELGLGMHLAKQCSLSFWEGVVSVGVWRRSGDRVKGIGGKEGRREGGCTYLDQLPGVVQCGFLTNLVHQLGLWVAARDTHVGSDIIDRHDDCVYVFPSQCIIVLSLIERYELVVIVEVDVVGMS